MRCVFRWHTFCLLLVVLSALVFPAGSFAASYTVDQCAICGPTGGTALQVILSGISPGTSSTIALINTSASYDPTTIGNIDVSVSKDSSFSQATALEISISSGFRAAIEQGGKVYIDNPGLTGTTYGSLTTPAAFFTSGWGTIQCNPTSPSECPNSQTSLMLSNFMVYNFNTGTFGTATPSLTAPVYFGLASISSFNNTSIVNGTAESDFANLNISDGPLLVDSNFNDLSSYQVFETTPEPSTLLLLGTGLADLCASTRRIRKS